MNLPPFATSLVPEIFLAVCAMALLILGVFRGNHSTTLITWLTCLAIAISALCVLNVDVTIGPILHGMIITDTFAVMMKLLVMFGLVVSLVLSIDYLKQEGIARYEYPILVALAGIGMLFMVSANNMLSMYMAIELQSLSLYVLAAFHRNCIKSSEAALKYFILGALSSGMLLFGISLIYGYTGSLDFTVIKEVLTQNKVIMPGFTFGLAFLLAGLAFKISAVPFHMWTPDVYQGAPTNVTALFAIVPKIAAIALIMRILLYSFAPISHQWGQIIIFLALASMIVSAFAALGQEDIKRLMAYSSIGNMGYALVGIATGTLHGAGAVILFLSVYLFMTTGVFSIILYMRKNGLAADKITDLSGLSKTRPLLAYSMAALMFSMAGIPPLAGFISKLFIFQAAVEQQLYFLAITGIISSVIAAYYYLKIVKVMFFDDQEIPIDNIFSPTKGTLLFISVLFVVGFIIAPGFLYNSAMAAAQSLF